MKKVLIATGAVLAIAALAAIAVNFVSEKEADEFYAVKLCSDMTKQMMKSPASYRMANFSYKIDEIPSYRMTEKMNNMSDSLKESVKAGHVKYDTQEVFINYEAKNPMGVELSGSAICNFERSYGYDSDRVRTAEPYYFQINNEAASEDVRLYASTMAEKRPGTYERKINYLINKIFN